jgi:hypothetical protein
MAGAVLLQGAVRHIAQLCVIFTVADARNACFGPSKSCSLSGAADAAIAKTE